MFALQSEQLSTVATFQHYILAKSLQGHLNFILMSFTWTNHVRVSPLSPQKEWTDAVLIPLTGFVLVFRTIWRIFMKHGTNLAAIRRCIRKFPDWVVEKQHKGLWRQNSQNSDTTAPSGREMYHLQFSLQQVASPETFGYTLVRNSATVLPNFLPSSIQTRWPWEPLRWDRHYATTCVESLNFEK
jgi:hypothetical protein